MAVQHRVSPLWRLAAFGIDALWLLGTSVPALWGFSEPGGWQLSAAWAATVALLSLGAVPCWLLWGGTPGQLLLSQRVVDAQGYPGLTLLQAVMRWAASGVTVPLLGLGLIWPWVDRAHLGLQDRLSATCVVDPLAEDTEMPVWRQHWVGDLSPEQSLWVHAVLLPLPIWLLLSAIDAWAQVHTGHLRTVSAVLLLATPLWWALLVWGGVGAWRSARGPWGRPGPGLARWLDQVRRGGVRVAVGILAAAVLLPTLIVYVSRLPERALLVWGSDPIGAATAALSSDGRRLRIQGPLGVGDAARIGALMQSAPTLRLVAIDSPQGRWAEATALAARVRERRLATRATGPCIGACPLVFLAGERRQLLPGATLGFHRVAAGPLNGVYQRLVNRELGHVLAAAGLRTHLVTKTLATPPTQHWVPAADELASSGLVSVPVRPLDVDLPAAAGAVETDYVEALSTSRLWLALERRFPGIVALAGARMGAAAASGEEAVQIAGHEVVAAQMPLLLDSASPESRWLYTDVLRDQVEALSAVDPSVCRDLLLGDAMAHRRLPQALAWREAEWLLGALAEAPRPPVRWRPSALELEVIRRTLGRRAPGQLAALWRPTTAQAARETRCDTALALLGEMQTLTAPLRRLALRMMYERE
jgi:hypothetical protein